MMIVLVLAGVALLYFGGEMLVSGAVNLSRLYGLSPLVIGLTVVAFGTSAPELASSLIAASRGSGAIAIGNVIGSNTANIGLILGFSALIFPIVPRAQFLRREVPILVGASLLLPLVLWGGEVTRRDGTFLCLLILPYLWILTRNEETADVGDEFSEEYGETPSSSLTPFARAGLGMAMLVVGAAALIEGAVELARAVGVTERVIGITVVAFGTSLPELATCTVAAFRREGDIALGNIVGSNVFNILCVLGVTAAWIPLQIDTASLWGDIAIMLGFTLALIPCVITGRRIARSEGAFLVLGYIAYVIHLLMESAPG